jgi:hypothetical protein
MRQEEAEFLAATAATPVQVPAAEQEHQEEGARAENMTGDVSLRSEQQQEEHWQEEEEEIVCVEERDE